MSSILISQNVNGCGLGINTQVERSADHPNAYGCGGGSVLTVPMAKSGSLTTRTDDNTGVLTLGTSHGITDADKVTVYWSGGRRYGMAVTTYDGTTITVDGGAGDVLPAGSTVCIVGKALHVHTTIDGDAAVFEIFRCYRSLDTNSTTTRSTFVFYDSSDNVIGAINLVGNGPDTRDITGGDTNPLTGALITYAYLFQEGTAETATAEIFTLEDSTP